jgi:hypothetical protein
MSKSALYNEALSQPAATVKCRHCRRVITTFENNSELWWKHVTTNLIVCGDPAGTLRVAKPAASREVALSGV